MMNLSSLYRSNQNIYFLVLALVILVGLGLTMSFVYSGVISVLILIGLFLPTATSSRDDELLGSMKKVLKSAGEGDLEGRITDIPQDSKYFDIAWGYNNLVDQVEAFMRDTTMAIELAGDGNVNGVLFEEGFKGSFCDAVTPISVALKGILASKILEIKGSLGLAFDKIGGGSAGGIISIREDIKAGSEMMQHIAQTSEISSVTELFGTTPAYKK